MAYRRTIAQRDHRLKRVRFIAQAVTVVAGLGGSIGVGYLAQATTSAGAAATTTSVAPATTHVVAPPVTTTAKASVNVAVKVPANVPAKAPAKAVAPVVKTAPPVAAPAAKHVVCVTSPSGTVTCH